MPTKKIDVDALARAIMGGIVTPRFLPHEVYNYNAKELTNAIVKGMDVVVEDIAYNSPDWQMLQHMRENVYMFSAAKTFQQTAEMTSALMDGNTIRSFNEFRKEVGKISQQYNIDWLRTEYNTAVASSQSASAWRDFERNKTLIPYLRYSTIGDACPICAPLNGVKLPVGHPFWNTHNVPNHFNCLCILESEPEAEGITQASTVDALDEHLKDLKDPMFMTNVGKTQTVFNKKHPYFSVPKEWKDFASLNFGLDIPPLKK